jgi:hypothetical protein
MVHLANSLVDPSICVSSISLLALILTVFFHEI